MQMIIANRLIDGRVVFMDADAAWVDSIEEGILLETAADNDRRMGLAMRDVEDCVIVDPYLIDVVMDDGKRRPVEAREAIRAFGPSVRTDQPDGSG
jgi:sulfite reductase (NADPH) hemoprotein beta-component